MKRRCLAAWLVIFGLWPLVQHGLVRAYGIRASRFAGWARHAVPELRPNVTLMKVDLGSAVTLADIKLVHVLRGEWSRELAAEWSAYVARRRALGKLAPPPDALGRRLLAEHGEQGMVLVAVAVSTLNRQTKMVDVEVEKYTYRAGRDDVED